MKRLEEEVRQLFGKIPTELLLELWWNITDTEDQSDGKVRRMVFNEVRARVRHYSESKLTATTISPV